MLKLTDVNTFYGPIQALKNVSLTVNEREIVSLLGGNACGKSTTMKTILGLVRPKQGRVEFFGRRIDRLPSSEHRPGRDRAGAGGAAAFSLPHRAREPADGRLHPQRHGRGSVPTWSACMPFSPS